MTLGVLAVLVGLTGTCGGPDVKGIVIIPSYVYAQPGTPFVLTARLLTKEDGLSYETLEEDQPAPTWTASNPNLLAVSPTSGYHVTVTVEAGAGTPGPTTITATAAEFSATATVYVVQGPTEDRVSQATSPASGIPSVAMFNGMLASGDCVHDSIISFVGVGILGKVDGPCSGELGEIATFSAEQHANLDSSRVWVPQDEQVDYLDKPVVSVPVTVRIAVSDLDGATTAIEHELQRANAILDSNRVGVEFQWAVVDYRGTQELGVDPNIVLEGQDTPCDGSLMECTFDRGAHGESCPAGVPPAQPGGITIYVVEAIYDDAQSADGGGGFVGGTATGLAGFSCGVSQLTDGVTSVAVVLLSLRDDYSNSVLLHEMSHTFLGPCHPVAEPSNNVMLAQDSKTVMAMNQLTVGQAFWMNFWIGSLRNAPAQGRDCFSSRCPVQCVDVPTGPG
jgi:hypothetical protein